MEKLVRLPDWAARLSTFIDGVKRDPFFWGKADCVVGWALGAIEAQTGVKLLKGLGKKYTTATGAMRVMKGMGVKDLAAAIALHLPVHKHPSLAQMGDLAVIKSDGPFGFGIGIVNGETVLVRTETGMGVLPRTAIVKAFKVG